MNGRGFYVVLGRGVWVGSTCKRLGALGMGIQFFGAPRGLPRQGQAIGDLLRVPDDLELMAVYRLGYLPEGEKRPSIDWSSRHRKRLEQFVSRETCHAPEREGTETEEPERARACAAGPVSWRSPSPRWPPLFPACGSPVR